MSSVDPVFSHSLRVAELAARKPTRFSLAPGPDECRAIAASLGLLAVKDLGFRGEIRSQGRQDWVLEATLKAVVTQACVVTLAPVDTAISEPVLRRFLAEMPEPDDAEVEIPEDDSAEQLGNMIDIGTVLLEALTLSLPLYPRAEGAELGAAIFTEPGAEPLSDESLRPFAGLSDLLKKGGHTE